MTQTNELTYKQFIDTMDTKTFLSYLAWKEANYKPKGIKESE